MKSISSEAFEAWEPCRKLISHDHARRFGAVEVSAGDFALSWHSDLIEPCVATGSDGDTWVGVDQRVACISRDGRIVVSLGLHHSLLIVRCFGRYTVVLSELEAIVFDREHAIVKLDSFPDLAGDVIEEDGELVVVLLDGRRQCCGVSSRQL